MSEKAIDQELTAYERAAAEGIDPRCIPQRLEEPPPVGDEIETPDYSNEDHEIWGTLFERQMSMLPGRASTAFLNGVDILGMTATELPSLRMLSRNMEKATGWKIARIPGLLHVDQFFDLISRRLFPSTDYIRGRDEIDYTPAPDCFHDIFGHMPMLTDPDFADFYQLFGKAGLKATEGANSVKMERLHWFTVEFGLIRQASGTRIFGAGILSSKNEVEHALSEEVEVRPFDPEKIVEQDYDVWRLQDVLFAVESYEQLKEGFFDWTRRHGLL